MPLFLQKTPKKNSRQVMKTKSYDPYEKYSKPALKDAGFDLRTVKGRSFKDLVKKRTSTIMGVAEATEYVYVQKRKKYKQVPKQNLDKYLKDGWTIVTKGIREEMNLQELSDALLKRYIKKADKHYDSVLDKTVKLDRTHTGKTISDKTYNEKRRELDRKHDNRLKGLIRASNKVNEEIDLQELSRDLLKRYMDKRDLDAHLTHRAMMNSVYKDRQDAGNVNAPQSERTKALSKKLKKRSDGYSIAFSKYMGSKRTKVKAS